MVIVHWYYYYGCIVVLITITIMLAVEVRKLKNQLVAVGNDHLTQLPLRAKFLIMAASMFRAASNEKFGFSLTSPSWRRKDDDKNGGKVNPLTVMMFNIDNLRAVNAKFSRSHGDCAIGKLGFLLRRQCRAGELVGRWDGDTFVVVLATDVAGARLFYRRVAIEFFHDTQTLLSPKDGVTLTCGAAEFDVQNETLDKLLKVADHCLRTGKIGRNRFVYRNPESDIEVIDAEMSEILAEHLVPAIRAEESNRFRR